MNTLTGLIPIIYASLNVVSRELIGFIPAVTTDANLAERAAVGQIIRSPVAPESIVNDVNPSMTLPEGDDQEIGYVDMAITHSKAVQIPWPGEDQLSLGSNNGTVFSQQIEEAFRRLANMVETSIGENYKSCSRAYGTPGTIPFASGISDAAQIRKLLVDNGALGDLRLVVGTGGGANIRSNSGLTETDKAGTDETLRKGTLLDLAGIKIHESAGVANHTASTGNGHTINEAAGYVQKTTDLAIDSGSDLLIEGDIVTIGNTPNKYGVATSTADLLTINRPGLIKPVADDAIITNVGDYEANMAFSRSAVQLAVRAPAIPSGGDAAVDRTTVVDPVSGLAFDISVYVGYKKKVIEVAIAWGSKVIKSEHTALLLG